MCVHERLVCSGSANTEEKNQAESRVQAAEKVC